MRWRRAAHEKNQVMVHIRGANLRKMYTKYASCGSKFNHELAKVNHARCGRMNIEYCNIMMHIRGANLCTYNVFKQISCVHFVDFNVTYLMC